MKKMKSLIKITIWAVLIIAVSYPAYAQLTVFPARQEIWLSAGEKKTIEYNLANKGEEPIEVVVFIQDWAKLEENKDIKVKDWLNPERKIIKIEPNESKVLKITVTAPKTAIGELVGMVSFEPRDKAMPMVSPSLGSAVYLVIKDTEKMEADVEDIRVVRSSKNILTAVDVFNKGNIHIRPRVSLTFEDKDGLKKSIDMPYGKPVFGERKFIFNKEISGEFLEDGSYKVTADIKCRGDYTFSKFKEIELKSEESITKTAKQQNK